MKENNKRPKRFRIVVIAGSVLVFLFVCVLGAELWLKHKIRKTIEREAVALAGNPVNVGIGRISVSIPRRSVTLRDITLRSQNEDTSRRDFTVVSLDAAIGRLSVRGIGYKKKDGKPALSAGSIVVVSPRGMLVTKSGTEEKKKEGKPLQEAITGKLNSVSIRNMTVSGAAFDYVAWKNDDKTRVGLQDGNFTVEEFLLDSMPPAKGKVFFSDDVRFSAGSVSYSYANDSFVLHADTIAINAGEGTLSLRRAELVPQYSKNEFAQKTGGRSDWTEFTLNGVECTGVDYADFFAGGILVIDSLALDGGHLASYKNRQVYQEPRTKPMLYQTIQDIPVNLDIRKAGFRNMGLEYDELAVDGDSPGVVRITDWSGTARNLTNVAEGHDRFFTINTTGTFMGACRLHAVFHFPVSPSDNFWEVIGRAGKSDLEIFNPAIEPLANLKIKSGQIRSMDFRITGTLQESHIVLTMLYNDLSVALMKKHQDDKARKFLTFIADEVLIKSDNPKREDGKVRVGEADFDRDPNRSMYNYLWKSLMAGVKKTVM